MKDNFYTSEKLTHLHSDAGSHFGKSITRYSIYRRDDVVNLGNGFGYSITVKHRIMIPNLSSPDAGLRSVSAYRNYPAILINGVSIKSNNDKAKLKLHSMFPRTLNASISTSASVDSGTTKSNSTQHTSGSSQSNVNTFGVGLSLGFFGELPMGGISTNYSHSWNDGTSTSQSLGNTAASTQQLHHGESMSVKDWSSYGYLDEDSVFPTWVWGQTYPWDVMQYNKTTDGSNIRLPDFIVDRLMENGSVLPPSQLSEFGLDFTMSATWLVDFPNGHSEDDFIDVQHKTTLLTASHEVQGNDVFASLQSSDQAAVTSYTSGHLDLSKFALNPIAQAQANGAAVGFFGRTFVSPPKPGGNFKILSPANNLQIAGKGFDSVMESSFKVNPHMEITFKILDTSVEYSLMMMHWIGKGSEACEVNWAVNDKYTGVFYVNKTEADGGQDNIDLVDLRDNELTSTRFHDYLVVGTNKIVIDIKPVNPKKGNSYSLFALAVGKV